MFACVCLITQAPYCAYGDNQNFMLKICFDLTNFFYNTTVENSAWGPLC